MRFDRSLALRALHVWLWRMYDGKVIVEAESTVVNVSGSWQQGFVLTSRGRCGEASCFRESRYAGLSFTWRVPKGGLSVWEQVNRRLSVSSCRRFVLWCYFGHQRPRSALNTRDLLSFGVGAERGGLCLVRRRRCCQRAFAFVIQSVGFKGWLRILGWG